MNGMRNIRTKAHGYAVPVELLKYTLTFILAAAIIISLYGNALAEKGLVIRGGAECTAAKFINGTGVIYNGVSGEISNLSVNCTNEITDISDSEKKHLTGIPHNKICVAGWEAIEGAGGKIDEDPLDDNEYHCLVSGKLDGLVKQFKPKPNPYPDKKKKK